MEQKVLNKKEVLQISINTLGNILIPAVLSDTMGKDILGVMGNLQKVIGMIEAEESAAAAAKEGGTDGPEADS